MTKMDLDRFAALVDAYGASPDRWPEAERAAAVELMKASAEVRRLADEADAIDRLLDQSETAPVSRALQDRILASLTQPPKARPRMLASVDIGRWLPAGAVGCSLILGVIAGTQLPKLAGLDDEAFVQAAVADAMTASAAEGDWLGGLE
jgi:hypothetical protein